MTHHTLITSDSPMADVIEGLQRADDLACYEFARRQGETGRRELLDSMPRLADATYAVMLSRTGELFRFKYPDTPDPIPFETMRQAMDCAAAGDNATELEAIVRPLGFSELATFRSTAGLLAHHATRLGRYFGTAPMIKTAKPEQLNLLRDD